MRPVQNTVSLYITDLLTKKLKWNALFCSINAIGRIVRITTFKITRFTIAKFFQLWIKKIVGIDNIPPKEPAIFVCNHRSYFDFIILGSIILKDIIFLAQRKISRTFFISWLTRFHKVIYIDTDYPGSSFFKRMLRYLDTGKSVVIYPEGTRSRTGKMLLPKLGFVKLAMKANVPIIPVAMKGTYQILPPHRYIPNFKKCEIIINKKMYISPDNPDFRDIFFRRRDLRKFSRLTKEELQEVAIRIMDKIRILANEEWDDNALREFGKFKKNDKSLSL
jgi:1-acyl-sn-glycerol-3-phosphate acyltransferase